MQNEIFGKTLKIQLTSSITISHQLILAPANTLEATNGSSQKQNNTILVDQKRNCTLSMVKHIKYLQAKKKKLQNPKKHNKH